MDALASWRWCLQAERLQDGNAAMHTAIADLLWLQTQQIVELRNEIEHEHNDSPPSPSPVNPGPIDNEPPPKPKPSPKPIDPTPHPTPKPNHLRPPEADDAWRLRTASASPLPEARALAKHMRRLRKPILNPRVLKLDEAASIEASVCAERRWPVLGYGRERWLSLDLLIEQNTSMAIWQDSLRAFEKLCQRVGAFRDVRLWYFDPGTRSISTRDGAPARPLRVLKQSQGRSLIWFAGNLAHTAWHQPDLLADLSMLARQQIVAVLQLLPERLWERSKLARLPQSQWCYFGSRQAGSPNQRYIAEPQDAWPLAPERSTTLKLPMLSFEPLLMQAYANFLRAPSATLMPGLWIDRCSISAPNQNNVTNVAAQPAINIKPPEEEVLRRLQQFKRHASDGAKNLLQLLWAMPLWLPLIRLVQRKLLPQTGNAELAEVLHSGLLFRINQTDHSGEALRFNFFDPVRLVLKADSTLHDTLDVKHLISVELTRRFGSDVLIGAQSGEDDFATFAEIGELLRSRLYAHSSKGNFSVVERPVAAMVSATVASGIISLPAYSISEDLGSSISLPFHISGGAGQMTCKVNGAGFSVSPNPLSLLVGVPFVLTVKHTGSVVGAFTGQLVCTPVAPAVGGPFVYNLAVVVNPVRAEPIRPLEGKRILWVDNDFAEKIAKFTQLKALGVADVRHVNTTIAALEALNRGGFDAVITDLGRKGKILAGLTLVNEIDTKFPSIPIAIYSNSFRSFEKFENQARQFGAITCTNNFNDVTEAFAIHFLTSSSAREKRIWPRAALERLRIALNLSMDSNDFDAITFGQILVRNKASGQSERLRLIDRVLKALLGRKTVHAIVVPAPRPNSTLITKGNIVSRPNSDGNVCISVIRENGALLLSERQNKWVYEALSLVVQTRDAGLFSLWATDQALLELPAGARVSTMTEMYFTLYRAMPTRGADLRNSLLNVVRAQWNSYCEENGLMHFEPDIPDKEFNKQNASSTEGALLLVSEICFWVGARMELPDALKDRITKNLNLLDQVVSIEIAKAVIVGLPTDAHLTSLTDSPRAWVAFDMERGEIDPLRREMLGIALETFGYGSTTTDLWFSTLVSDETVFRASGNPASPWSIEVQSQAELSTRPGHIVCETDDDAKIITNSLAAHTITNRREGAGSYLDFDHRSDLALFLSSLLKTLEMIETKIAASNLMAPVFVHTHRKQELSFFEVSELPKYNIFLLDGPAKSTSTELSSILIRLALTTDVIATSASTRAVLLATDSLLTFKLWANKLEPMPVFVITTSSVESDLSEFARELREMVADRNYPTDPQDKHKNKFGRYSTRKRRTLSATVKPLPFLDGEYLVTLKVYGEYHWPLLGEVMFHFDQRFTQRWPRKPGIAVIAPNNQVTIRLAVWGAFTIGVWCDDGLTNLELDLAELTDAPPEFLAAEAAPTFLRLRMSDLMVAMDFSQLRIVLRGAPELVALFVDCDKALVSRIDRDALGLIESAFECRVSGSLSDNSIVIDPEGSFDRTLALINAQKLAQFTAT